MKIRLRDGGTLRILALRAQELVDYSMPLRCMNYDMQEYRKQLRRLQAGNDRTGAYRTPSERLCRLPLDYEIRMPETGRDGLHRPPRSILFWVMCVWTGAGQEVRSFGQNFFKSACPFSLKKTQLHFKAFQAAEGRGFKRFKNTA